MGRVPKVARCSRRTPPSAAVRFLVNFSLIIFTVWRCSWFVWEQAESAGVSPPCFLPGGLGRRQGLLAAGFPGVLIGSGAAPQPAEAIFGFFEKPWGEFSVSEAFNISMPPGFDLISKDDPKFLVWRGDRVQPLERMTASAKVVNYPDLATALKSSNITQVGMDLAEKRKAGRAQLADARKDPAGAGLDVWLFEFDGEQLHELVLFGLVRKGSDQILCSVNLRTPSLVWTDKREQFNEIMSTFKPLEAQPNRTSGYLADNAQLQTFYEAASANNSLGVFR